MKKADLNDLYKEWFQRGREQIVKECLADEFER